MLILRTNRRGGVDVMPVRGAAPSGARLKYTRGTAERPI